MESFWSRVWYCSWGGCLKAEASSLNEKSLILCVCNTQTLLRLVYAAAVLGECYTGVKPCLAGTEALGRHLH